MRTFILLTSVTLLLFNCSKSDYIYPDTFHPPWPASDIHLTHGDVPYSLMDDLKTNKPRVTLLFFGFTHCPDICPATMQRSAQALTQLSAVEIEKIRFLFISVDPARDTPKLANAYAEGFHPKMFGLSGTEAETAAVIKAYAVHTGNHNGEISHSGAIYWITPDAKVTKRISQDFNAQDLAHDLKLAAR
ncbi:MAG: SCO family protein [Spirochaetia bacterium]|nr:SCO family protein [Spirochaetia bacterium]